MYDYVFDEHYFPWFDEARDDYVELQAIKSWEDLSDEDVVFYRKYRNKDEEVTRADIDSLIKRLTMWEYKYAKPCHLYAEKYAVTDKKEEGPYLKKQYEVLLIMQKNIAQDFGAYSWKTIRSNASKSGIHGVMLLTKNRPIAMELIEEIKARNPDIPIIDGYGVLRHPIPEELSEKQNRMLRRWVLGPEEQKEA